MRKCGNGKCVKSDARYFSFFRNAKYCPICGDETVKIKIFPINLFFDTYALYGLGVLMFLAAVFGLLIPAIIGGCQAHGVKNNEIKMAIQQTIESFPPEWQQLAAIYYRLAENRRWDYIESLSEDAKLPDPCLLNTKQTEFLMSHIHPWYQGDLAAVLSCANPKGERE